MSNRLSFFLDSLATGLTVMFDPQECKTETQQSKENIITEFHKLYYDEGNRSPILNNTRWMGIPLVKCPLDLWVYQEIMFEVKPRLVIETGTLHGGSALWLAQMMHLIHTNGWGWEVLSVDLNPQIGQPAYPRINFIRGSSTSMEVYDIIVPYVETLSPVMVILDSDHRANHVLRELEMYSKFVTPGSYLIVEDTNIGGHPVLPGWGKGPMEAVMSWLPKHPEFEIDKSRERFLLTMNPNGFLRRIK